MHTANGSAAVARGGDAQIRGGDFFATQLEAATLTATSAARALIAACEGGRGPPDLDAIAERMILAAAELRIAAAAATPV